MLSADWRAVDPSMRASLESQLVAAPISISALAHSLGVKVISAVLPAGISGEIRPDASAPSGFTIRVNKNDPSRRQRFTVAHELAHFLLHQDAIGNGVTDDVLYRSTLSDAREAQANRVAADLLMPRDLLDEWLKQAKALGVEDIVEFLSDKFAVSTAAMKVRLGVR